MKGLFKGYVAKQDAATKNVDPVHFATYSSAVIPDWFPLDTSNAGHVEDWTPQEHASAAKESRQRDWLWYLDATSGLEREAFHKDRLALLAGHLEACDAGTCSSDDDDPPPPLKRRGGRPEERHARKVNNNKARHLTMLASYDEAYAELGPLLDEVHERLGTSMFMTKRLLKRWCAERK